MATLALLATMVLAACNPAPRDAPVASTYLQPGQESSFSIVAMYETLGNAWLEHGGRTGISNIYSDEKGQRLLFEFGSEYPCLWLDLTKGRETDLLEFQSFLRIMAVDMDNSRAYMESLTSHKSTPGEPWPTKIAIRSLPEFDSIMPGYPYAKYIDWPAVSSHPRFSGWWEAGTDESDKYELRRTVSTTDGNIVQITELNEVSNVRPACTAGGQLFYSAANSGEIWSLDADNAGPVLITRISNPDFKFAADRGLENVCWVYEHPVSGSAGSERNAAGETPGLVRCIDPTGKILASMETGSIPFDVISGDWGNRRCLVYQNSVGIALLDFRADTLTWILRVSDDTPLFISEQGNRIFALLRDSIVQIGVEDLLELAPQLTVGNSLPTDETTELKTAVQSLGWHWDGIVVSPLLEFSDAITLFDSNDPQSTWSELDWSFSEQRADRLLIARKPNATDLAVREMSAGGVDAWSVALLKKLGWPNCDLIEGSADKYDLHYRYALEPQAIPPLAAGEFEVWITDGAAFYSLEGATISFPENAADIETVRSAAASACMQPPWANDDELLIQDIPEAGWALGNATGSYEFLDSATEGAVACFRVECIRDGAADTLIVVLLDAVDCSVLDESPSRFSPLANQKLQRGRFSPLEDGS